MSSFLILLLLLMIVLLLFVFPVKEKRIDFDEKGEAIKVYKDEVAHLERQLAKGFIDEDEKSQLLAELDKKSALAISSIEKRSYSYRRSLVPLVLTVVGLAVASLLYFRHYQGNGVYRWQAFNFANRGAITEGLFDKHVVEGFISKTDAKTGAAYCFAMQRTLLEKYDTNPDTLANLAQCHLAVGYPSLAVEAAQRGLKSKPEHAELNYVMAEADFIENKSLSPASLDRLLGTIKKDPSHFNALRLLAINSLSQGQYKQARFFFSQLKKLSGNNPELLSALERMDNEIAEKMNAEQTPQTPKTTISPLKPEKTAEQNADKTADKTEGTQAVSIAVSVRIAPNIAEQLSGSQTLFIVVKSTQGQLLNATKHSVNDFTQPLSLTITDNQAGAMQMQPMAGHDSINVVARISQSGSPMASSGDMTSQPVAIALPQSATASVVIDSVVP